MATTATDAIAALPPCIWLYLLCARGGFWRVSRQLAPPETRPSPALTPTPAPRVVAIIPARNEAAVIGDAVQSLLQQQAGSIHVIVVDDGSTDATQQAALHAAAAVGRSENLSLVTGAPLPSGWSGKVWAMSQGVAAAGRLRPDYLLFTDADIHHDSDSVAALIALAAKRRLDLVSYMVRLHMTTVAERWLIPAFVFFFLKLYPPAWVASSERSIAAAAGGCMLVRPEALERAGGFESLRSQIIDDCALARAIKRSGGAIWLGLTRSAHSTRPYGSWAEIGRMIARTAFNQLQHSYLLLAATLIGLLLTYLLPPLLLLSGHAPSVALGAAAWLLMGVAYLPMLRFYGLSSLRALGLPAVALFYAGATVYSAVQYTRGRGGQWKGRAQDVRAGR